MNWTEILFYASIPDSPGRAVAVQEAVQMAQEKAETKALTKSRNSSRQNRFPGLKHGAD